MTPHPKFKKGCHLKSEKGYFFKGWQDRSCQVLLRRAASWQPYAEQTSQILRLPNVSNSFSAPKLIFFFLCYRQRAPRGMKSLRGHLTQLAEVPLECQPTEVTTCNSAVSESQLSFLLSSLSSSGHFNCYFTQRILPPAPSHAWEVSIYLFISKGSSWSSSTYTYCRSVPHWKCPHTWWVRQP